jgi:hypothetical protein
VLLLTVGPIAYWGLRHVPLWAKFRKISGGYEARRWFKRAVIVSGVYEATRRPSEDLNLMSSAQAPDPAKKAAPPSSTADRNQR